MTNPIFIGNTSVGDPSDAAVQAGKLLGDGAEAVYQRLRQLEQDEMSKSTSAILAAYAATPSVPVMLPPVALGVENTTATTSVSAQKVKAPSLIEAKMGADIAAAWATAVHEAAHRRYDLENSPIFRAQEAYWREFRNGEHPSANSTAHSITATFIIGATFIGFVGPTGRTETQSSYNTVSDAMQQVTSLVPGPADMRAELGLIGATLAYGAVFQAAWITAGEAGKTKPQGNQLTLQFATNYADRLIARCKDPAYDLLLTTLITEHLKNNGAQPPTHEKLLEMIAMVKFGMLMSAAALFYQAETGGQTGVEVAALLDPKATPLSPSNPRAKLLTQMQQLLHEMADPGVRQLALENMMAFLDNNKSVKSLTDPAQILLGIFGGDASITIGSTIAAA